MTEFSLDFPRAYGELNASAIFREQPEDFKVDEDLGFEPLGVGEHVFLQILKRGENTAWVAGKIAELAKAEPSDDAAEAFLLHAGTKVNVTETLEGWKKVQLPDENVGWLPAKTIKEVKAN